MKVLSNHETVILHVGNIGHVHVYACVCLCACLSFVLTKALEIDIEREQERPQFNLVCSLSMKEWQLVSIHVLDCQSVP